YSSRRRHTRFSRDWSSDVCSSDLSGSTKEKNPIIVNLDQQLLGLRQSLGQSLDNSARSIRLKLSSLQNQSDKINSKIFAVPGQRSEERRVGKWSRTRVVRQH